MSNGRPSRLSADDRARLLRAADDRPLGVRLLAYLVIDDGLTIPQAVGVRGRDLSGTSVTIETKAGQPETRQLCSTAAELARRATNEAAPDAALVTGRTGRPMSTAAARDILLGIVRASGVPVRSVHQLRGDRHVVAAA